MIPLNPSSTLTRTKKFVSEEWNAYFANGRVAQANNVAGGWKGLLYANLAIVDPKASYDFFAQANFDPSWLDGGASRTWYLAYAAGELPIMMYNTTISKMLTLRKVSAALRDGSNDRLRGLAKEGERSMRVEPTFVIA